MPEARQRSGAGGRGRRVQLMLGAIALVVVAAGLKVAHSVVLPFAFALFLALMLKPAQAWVAARVPRRLRWLGTVAAMGLLLAALALLGAGVALAATQLQREGPQLVQSLQQQLSKLGGLGDPKQLKEQGAKAGALLLSTAASALTEGVLVLFFTLLMLLEAHDWRERVRRTMAPQASERLLDTAAEVGHSVRRYLVSVTLVALISGVSQGLFLWAMGVKLALVWGLLVFVLSYIPIIGSIVAAVPPVLFALLTQGPARGALVAGGMFLLEQVTGNFIGPVIEGKGMKLPPLMVLLSVTFWGFLWGPIGALLAVPLTVAVTAACARIPVLAPAAALLGHETPRGDGRERRERRA